MLIAHLRIVFANLSFQKIDDDELSVFFLLLFVLIWNI